MYMRMRVHIRGPALVMNMRLADAEDETRQLIVHADDRKTVDVTQLCPSRGHITSNSGKRSTDVALASWEDAKEPLDEVLPRRLWYHSPEASLLLLPLILRADPPCRRIAYLRFGYAKTRTPTNGHVCG